MLTLLWTNLKNRWIEWRNARNNPLDFLSSYDRLLRERHEGWVRQFPERSEHRRLAP